MTDITLPRLYERDIDVLLQEELLFSHHVRQVLGRALGFEVDLDVKSCDLSVVDTTGETDIFVVYDAEAEHGVILIENKIDAAFQPRQPERYRERATALVQAQDFSQPSVCS